MSDEVPEEVPGVVGSKTIRVVVLVEVVDKDVGHSPVVGVVEYVERGAMKSRTKFASAVQQGYE